VDKVARGAIRAAKAAAVRAGAKAVKTSPVVRPTPLSAADNHLMMKSRSRTKKAASWAQDKAVLARVRAAVRAAVKAAHPAARMDSFVPVAGYTAMPRNGKRD